MLISPEALQADLDVNFDYTDYAEPSHEAIVLGQGFNATAIRVGETVVKVSKRSVPEAAAQDWVQIHLDELHTQAQFIPDHVAPTEYVVAPSIRKPNRSRIVTIKPFEPGQTIAEHLADSDPNNDELVNFLRLSSRMYARTSHWSST